MPETGCGCASSSISRLSVRRNQSLRGIILFRSTTIDNMSTFVYCLRNRCDSELGTDVSIACRQLKVRSDSHATRYTTMRTPSALRSPEPTKTLRLSHSYRPAGASKMGATRK
jgi:hypothetical protein